MRRAQVRGTAAGDLIERIGEPLIGALEAFAAQVPFPLQDSHECWLLDERTGDPLVLIDTRLPSEPIPPAERLPRWLPGQAARAGFPDLDRLEAMVAQRAGKRPQGVWFRRSPDGSAATEGEDQVTADNFPRLLLTSRWARARQRGLARAFVDWWAPALLQLQHLDDRERAGLERAAVRRAGVLARLYRLYPKILDQRLIRVARVQARVQGAAQTGARYTEPFLWAE